MDTIKTAFVVALLLAVLYGVYVVLNKEQPPPPPEVAGLIANEEQGDLLSPPDIDVGSFTEPPGGANPADVPTTDDAGVASPLPSSSPVETDVTSNRGGVSSLPEVPPQYASTLPPRTDRYSSDPSLRDNGSSSLGPLPTALPPSDGPPSDGPPSDGPPSDPLGPRGAPRGFTTGPTSPSADGRGFGGAGEPTMGDSSEPMASSSSGLTSPHADSPSSQPDSRWARPESHPQTQLGPPTSSPDSESAMAIDSQPVDSGSAGGPAAISIAEGLSQAQALAAEGKYHEALRILSQAYVAETSTDADRRAAHELLDPLAGRVIYSREHLLLPPHVVAAGETLEQIAEKYRVPAQLLSNINGLGDPNALAEGLSLKVVEGPFRADVDSVDRELTLYVQDLYAGRFAIQIGDDPRPTPGNYMVLTKQEGRTYYGRDGTPIPSHEPSNPYGSVWIDLGAGNLCIHGSPRVASTMTPQGCISLGPRDAVDVYGILSIGSRVTIAR